MSRCHQRHLYGRHTLHDLTCTLACLELVERYLTEKYYYCTCVRLLDYFFVSEQGCPYNIRVFLSGSTLRDLLRGIWFFVYFDGVCIFLDLHFSSHYFMISLLSAFPTFSPRWDPLHAASVSPSPLLQGKCDSLSLSQSKMTAEAKCFIDNRVDQLVNVVTFMLFSWILQAYKQGMYGPKYVWVLFSGRNQANWWKQQSHLGDCTPEQVRKGLSNNIGTGELKLSPLPGPTICGRVPILILVHTCDIATQSLSWKKCFWSVFERSIEEMILTVAGQSQWLPEKFQASSTGFSFPHSYDCAYDYI